MKLPGLRWVEHFIEVPRVFYSTETDRRFERCRACGQFLLKNGVQYVIEKAIRQYSAYETTDVIFEYAMCLNCYQKITKSLSPKSRKNVRKFFDEHVDLVKRRKSLLKNNDLDIDAWLSKCIINGTPKSKLPEYQIFCQCDGLDMLFAYTPYLIGNVAMDEMVQLLSNQTLGELGGFHQKYLGPPTDLKELFDKPKVYLV